MYHSKSNIGHNWKLSARNLLVVVLNLFFFFKELQIFKEASTVVIQITLINFFFFSCHSAALADVDEMGK